MRYGRAGRFTKKSMIYKQMGGAMTPFFRVVLAILISVAAGLSSAHAQKVDPALFGALPAIGQAEISPNGKTVAVLQNQGGTSFLVFVELEDPSAQPKGVGVGAVKARDIEWIDDDHILLRASITQNLNTDEGRKTRELFRWISISKSDQKLKLLFKQDAGVYVTEAGNLMSTLPNKDGEAVIARWTPNARIGGATLGLGARFTKEDSGTGYSLFNVKLDSAREKISFPGQPDTVDWIVDENGDALLRIDYNPRTGVRSINKRQGNSKTISNVQTIQEEKGAGATIQFHAVGDNDNEYIVTSFGSGDKLGVYKYNVDANSLTEDVFRLAQFDIDRVDYDPRTAKVTGVHYTDDMPRTHHFDPEMQSLQDNLANALPGAAPRITSRSADGTRMIVTAIYTDRPSEIYTFDKTTKNLAFFSSTAPSISNQLFGKKEKFDYVAPDGLSIPGYLTLPTNTDRQNLPLVVLPHGGPASRDDLSFDWWAFSYAARGYAVYQPNFRGSEGYGYQFLEAGNGEWGRKMQADITNGVQKLVSDGIVDPARICIVGASYGGYAALAGATLTPDIYACAVSVNGVSDLPSLIGASALDGPYGADFWERRIGSRFRNADELNAVSPARQAALAGAPILLIHGKDDTVVPFYHSERMRDALAAANKPHEFVELDGEDHWLSMGNTRTDMLTHSIEFIDKHIGE